MSTVRAPRCDSSSRATCIILHIGAWTHTGTMLPHGRMARCVRPHQCSLKFRWPGAWDSPPWGLTGAGWLAELHPTHPVVALVMGQPADTATYLAPSLVSCQPPGLVSCQPPCIHILKYPARAPSPCSPPHAHDPPPQPARRLPPSWHRRART